MAVISVAAATLLGWPFCLVLALPIALDAIYSLGFFKTLFSAAASLPFLLVGSHDHHLQDNDIIIIIVVTVILTRKYSHCTRGPGSL